MKVAIVADPAGFSLKNDSRDPLRAACHREVADLGTGRVQRHPEKIAALEGGL